MTAMKVSGGQRLAVLAAVTAATLAAHQPILTSNLEHVETGWAIVGDIGMFSGTSWNRTIRSDTGENTEGITPAERIEQLRKSTGLNTNQIGKLFDVSRRSVHNWLNGSRMSLENIARLERIENAISAISMSGSHKDQVRILDSSEGRRIYQQLRDEVGTGPVLKVPAMSAKDMLS